MFSKELEELRKQGEIIPQLMSECESVSQQLQVQFSNEINYHILDSSIFFLIATCFSLLRLQDLKAKSSILQNQKMLIPCKIHHAFPSKGINK